MSVGFKEYQALASVLESGSPYLEYRGEPLPDLPGAETAVELLTKLWEYRSKRR